jgi:hypothetical protein
MAWFLLQKSPAVLVLYLATDLLFYYRKQALLSIDNLKDFLMKRRKAAFLFLLGVALFALVNLL